MNEDKSTRYRRLRRKAGILAVVARVGLLLALLGFGFSPALRGLSAEMALAAGVPELLRPPAEVALYALMLAILVEAVVFPPIWYAEFVLDRRYGLSRRRAGDWAQGHIATIGIHLAVWTAAAVVVYTAMRLWPSSWWMMAGVVFAGSTIAVTHLAPILVLPWLYHVAPLARPGLRARLEDLTRRVGDPVMGILEWRLGSDRPRANAALVGIGTTRRVLLTDALLADYSDDEIEVVLAHELGHHAHKDIWKTIAYEAGVATLACGAAHGALGWVGPSVGVESVWDVSGLPLFVLAAGSVVMLLGPVTNLMSRRHERRADQFALEVTGNPGALASGLRRVAAQRLAEERPSRLVEWLFYSHPPLSDRLAAVRRLSPPA